jgi:hypothetical protein
MQPMKTITLFAALALGTAVTQQAVACDLGLHADSTNATGVVCDNGACRSVEPSIAQQEIVATVLALAGLVRQVQGVADV